MDKKLKKTRKKHIAEFLARENYIPLKIDELAAVLDVPADEREDFRAVIMEMAEDGTLVVNKSKRCIPIKKKQVIGTLSCSSKKFLGYVAQPDKPKMSDILVFGENMNGALDGDTVAVEITHRRRGRYEGVITKVVERPYRNFIGVIIGRKNNMFKLRCDDRSMFAKIRIPPQEMMGAEINDRVAAEIIRYEDGVVYASVKKILSGQNVLAQITEGIISGHHLHTDFPESVTAALDGVPDAVLPEDLIKRLDLREKTIFTIDGDYSKDFDDAVSIEKTEAGFLLGVHIADVTHYVKEGDELDREAFLRTSSVYLADRTIPMLPEKLSNGICSLNPNADRLTLSVFMNFDNDGNRLDYKIHKSVIRSCMRMTYKNTAAILDGDKELIRQYKHIVPDLRLMKRLSAKLEKQRFMRGSIDFDIPESKPVLDDSGEVVGIEKEERLVSHKIIESFMLAANEAIAEFASERELPFVYRIHENLSAEKLAAVRDFLKKTGVRLVGKVDKDNPLRPKQIQSVINRTKNTPIEKIVSSFMLRSMMKARYSPECTGHFGLAARYYCHFTSPIRRYPDLAIHRILKEKLDRRLNKRRIASLTAFAEETSVRASDKEIAIMECEREVDDLMKTAYMSKFIGSEFTAKISSVTSFGIFAELENGAEGLIRIETLKSDHYIFDETLFRLTGKYTGREYNIGDEINVVLVRADIVMRQIDFIIRQESETAEKKNKKKEPVQAAAGTKKKKKKRRYYNSRKK